MLITSTVLDLETWGLFYFVHKLVVNINATKYKAVWELVKKSMVNFNIMWKI